MILQQAERRCFAAGRFGNYKSEPERAARALDTKKDPKLARLVSAWHSLLELELWYYKTICKSLKSIEVDSTAIESFSLALISFQGEESFPTKAGLFLSALINKCKDEEFVIHTSHLDQRINSLGYRNTKHIMVKGDVDQYLGCEMKRGSIQVDGDAWGKAGSNMRGGLISINGRAGYDLGCEMSGGRISVFGDGGERIGRKMRGGAIEVFGNGSDGTGQMMDGGTITVRGNTRFELGLDMKNGVVIVLGDAGKVVGEGMTGGRLYLLGDFFELSTNIKGGKTFHNGRFVVDK